MIPMSEGHGPQSGSMKPSGGAGGFRSIIQADVASRRGLTRALGINGRRVVSPNEIRARIRGSEIFRAWHWFRYHFDNELNGRGHPLARGFINAALACDARMPGYAEHVVDRVSSVGGREKHLPDWEQLLTILAELHVVAQIARWDWPEGVEFAREPTAPGSKRNPELSVQLNGQTFAYEVKAPSLFAHAAQRGSNPTQVASRYIDRARLAEVLGEGEGVTWPRDNPVKDFLISSEEKFAPFNASTDEFAGILVICWDDFIFEPVSALTHPGCGLFTPNSFYRSPDDEPVGFPSVGGVVLLRYLHQLVHACQDKPLRDGLEDPFDYGVPNSFPWKSFHQNPNARNVPRAAIDCLHARAPSPAMGAEYFPQEFITWLG